ncbi:Hsp20/alpha crystallin family protein [Tepidiforma sp.]|uniref:Hsp20/alpha crystallin family protein n=1 Tax=Tepidiforma sp. TaxID=2682230 RepID=UPI002ADE38F9|nr:Hsp20/alpha crystallin family protein [Tepidiforma sp.]
MSGVVRWNPFDDLGSLLPRDWLGRFGLQATTEWSPRCDVTERENEWVVHAELPGVEAKDMDVRVANGVLTIRGEKRSERTEEEKGRRYSERFFGSFERSLAVPENVDVDRIEASLKDGVLEVRLPKRAPSAADEGRRIEIRTS